jgi:hypothetical protein
MGNKYKCIPDLQLPEFSVPKPNPEDVKTFVKNFEDRLSKEQKETLLFFAEKFYGFHLSSLDMTQSRSWSPSHVRHIEHIAIFNWGLGGEIKGEITINF